MDSNNILIIVICSFISIVLVCSCGKFCIDTQRNIRTKLNIQKLCNSLKNKRIIKPISIDIDNEEIKDEKENELRFTERISNNEDNV
jgi:hypothetical protein